MSNGVSDRGTKYGGVADRYAASVRISESRKKAYHAKIVERLSRNVPNFDPATLEISYQPMRFSRHEEIYAHVIFERKYLHGALVERSADGFMENVNVALNGTCRIPVVARGDQKNIERERKILDCREIDIYGKRNGDELSQAELDEATEVVEQRLHLAKQSVQEVQATDDADTVINRLEQSIEELGKVQMNPGSNPDGNDEEEVFETAAERLGDAVENYRKWHESALALKLPPETINNIARRHLQMSVMYQKMGGPSFNELPKEPSRRVQSTFPRKPVQASPQQRGTDNRGVAKLIR